MANERSQIANDESYFAVAIGNGVYEFMHSAVGKRAPTPVGEGSGAEVRGMRAGKSAKARAG